MISAFHRVTQRTPDDEFHLLRLHLLLAGSMALGAIWTARITGEARLKDESHNPSYKEHGDHNGYQLECSQNDSICDSDQLKLQRRSYMQYEIATGGLWAGLKGWAKVSLLRFSESLASRLRRPPPARHLLGNPFGTDRAFQNYIDGEAARAGSARKHESSLPAA